MTIVEILKDDPRLKLKKGHLYLAKSYWLDPSEKFTLIRRITREGRVFKRDPECNEYRYNLKNRRDLCSKEFFKQLLNNSDENLN